MPFYKAYGLNISSEIELPELSVAEKTPNIDLYISCGNIVLRGLRKTPIHRRGIQAYQAIDNEGNLILHWDQVASFKAIQGNQLVVSPLTKDANLLSLFTISEALAMILFQKGYFLLHASAVKVGNKAWCFMGVPGAGKSTTAAAFVKAGCALLSDDLTAIKFDETGKPFIIPGYPQLKIWDNSVNGLAYDRASLQPVSEGVNKFSFRPQGDFNLDPVALGNIFFLHRAKNRPEQQALSPLDVPIETLKNFPLPTSFLKGKYLQDHFQQSFLCAKSAGLWRRRRPNGFDLLEKWVSESISSQSDILLNAI
ncbi:serine kinase [Dyadobacter sp. CY345]|uniref:serine kinase n=1 Tax=Dyadobacter sp. CY345 TaxID=2909335 RepID=UPI001F38144C|nr:serine kinase [Dyadobacter sp. CY345]MCF2443093.1 serine kinase [Dyadobacter sp. CY345]